MSSAEKISKKIRKSQSMAPISYANRLAEIKINTILYPKQIGQLKTPEHTFKHAKTEKIKKVRF